MIVMTRRGEELYFEIPLENELINNEKETETLRVNSATHLLSIK